MSKHYEIQYDRKLKTYSVYLDGYIVLLTRNGNIAREYVAKHESK